MEVFNFHSVSGDGINIATKRCWCVSSTLMNVAAVSLVYTIFCKSAVLNVNWKLKQNAKNRSKYNIPNIFSLFVCVVWLSMSIAFNYLLSVVFLLLLSKYPDKSPFVKLNTGIIVKTCKTNSLVSIFEPPIVWV